MVLGYSCNNTLHYNGYCCLLLVFMYATFIEFYTSLLFSLHRRFLSLLMKCDSFISCLSFLDVFFKVCFSPFFPSTSCLLFFHFSPLFDILFSCFSFVPCLPISLVCTPLPISFSAPLCNRSPKYSFSFPTLFYLCCWTSNLWETHLASYVNTFLYPIAGKMPLLASHMFFCCPSFLHFQKMLKSES